MKKDSSKYPTTVFFTYVRRILFSIIHIPRIKKIFAYINTHGSFWKQKKIVIDGHVFFAQKLDRILALYFLKYKGLEDSESTFFKKSIKKDWTIVDIGANLGYYSLLAARLTGPTGRVFAFEPDQENFRLLKENIQANQYKNIEALPLAVSNKSGDTFFYTSSENSGDHRIYDTGEDRATTKVKTIALDDFFQDDHIDFIKMDIQGAEPLAIQGMDRILRNNPHIIILTEFWPEGLRQCGTTPTHFLDTMKAYGFSLAYIDDASGTVKTSTAPELETICGAHGYINLLLKRT